MKMKKPSFRKDNKEFKSKTILILIGSSFPLFLIILIMNISKHWKFDLLFASCILLDITAVMFLGMELVNILRRNKTMNYKGHLVLVLIGFLSLFVSYLIHKINSFHYSQRYLVGILIMASLYILPNVFAKNNK
jgi:hypothetical protein